MDTLSANGTWPAVDYKTGCDAQRANWPAGIGHWSRVLAMAAAYHGGVPGADSYVKNAKLRESLSRAMGYWFANDFSTIGNGACLDAGGVAGGLCPCGTPGLWNTNWFSNVILLPTRVGSTCLLLRDELTESEYGNCTLITARAYAPFYRNPQPNFVSGANIIDMATVGIAAGLLENNRTGNASRITDAYQRVHNEVVVHPEDLLDGIKPDGSFQQHIGLIYDGNYGKDYSNSLLELELQAADTAFQANASARDAFASHIAGAQWMVFADAPNKTLHWDYTVVGRMIAFAISDNMASASLLMNLTRVQLLGDAWKKTELQKFAHDLSQTPKTANAGGLEGNRMFWNSDYMVHRTSKTVTTLRLLSNRTKTAECVNTQNPLGFHLSDGALYQYTNGQEYLNMYATFDFNLVPGTTTDYGVTKLACNVASAFGVESYAGGVSAGDVGIAAMRYVNPQTHSLSFRKAWFFFGDNVQHVLVSGVSSTTPAPVFSVLEQRLHKGDIFVDGDRVTSGNYCEVESLWHAGTGYVFPLDQGTELSIEAKNKTGDWKTIGTSTAPKSTKDMFTASIVHDSEDLGAPMEYSIFPAMKTHKVFQEKADQCTPFTVANGGDVSAAVDSTARVLGAAFWSLGGGSVNVARMGMTVYADRPLVLMLKLTGQGNLAGEVHVADPTHATGKAKVRIVWAKGHHRRDDGCKRLGHSGSGGSGAQRCARGGHPAEQNKEVVLEFGLPKGGMAGSGVAKTFKWSS
ncbi:galactose mutarotase-like protein [Ceratobasidium sp. AG-I]|nr:galactose mutarotase-like protein [Ceratobasidium sp. AG-I]